ncbi:hypothetical protein TNCV_2749481 [Trichonephila clavipes]|nr:hypothetical protein TNCV_2749481 [Trichonephila clavipes]
MLKRNNLSTLKCSSSNSEEAILMGRIFYKYVVDMLAEKNMINNEELIHANVKKYFLNQLEVDSSSDEYEPEEHKRQDIISLWIIK